MLGGREKERIMSWLKFDVVRNAFSDFLLLEVQLEGETALQDLRNIGVILNKILSCNLSYIVASINFCI